MPHLHRFFVPGLDAHAREARLPEAEAHHALHVVRLKPGDAVALMDGAGSEWRGRVSAALKREVCIEIDGHFTQPRPSTELILVQGWLHREKAIEEIIRRGAELGVARFIFFRAAHSERTPANNGKWLRWAIESCKQCGRLWLPRFDTADSLKAALELARPAQFILLTNTGQARSLRTTPLTPPVALIVGPEGDFAPSELDWAIAQGATAVSLGPATFRSEVAATIAAALALHELGMLEAPASP